MFYSYIRKYDDCKAIKNPTFMHTMYDLIHTLQNQKKTTISSTFAARITLSPPHTHVKIDGMTLPSNYLQKPVCSSVEVGIRGRVGIAAIEKLK